MRENKSYQRRDLPLPGGSITIFEPVKSDPENPLAASLQAIAARAGHP